MMTYISIIIAIVYFITVYYVGKVTMYIFTGEEYPFDDTEHKIIELRKFVLAGTIVWIFTILFILAIWSII